MTLTSEQRAKAITLAGKGVSRADVSRCLAVSRDDLDAAMQSDRELARAFGLGKVATAPARDPRGGYSELTHTCSPDRVAAHLSGNGISVEATVSGALRAQCECGGAMAIVQIHRHGVSYQELSRIRAHLEECGCSTPKRRARMQQSGR